MRNHINRKLFILNISIVFAICICSGLDSVNNHTVSVVEILVMGYEAARNRNTWVDAFSLVRHGNLYLVLPLVSSIATMPLLCDELHTNNYHFHICRVGIKKYVTRKYGAAVICNCEVLLAGFVLFGLFLFHFFPSVHNFGDAEVIGLVELNAAQMLLAVLKHTVYMLCWGSMLAVFTCGLVSITHNIYVVLCIPFLLNYIAAPYIRQWNALILIGITVVFYLFGYRLWIRNYQGVRA